MLQVLLLAAGDEELRQVGYGLEVEMPQRRRVLLLVVRGGAGEGAFAPDEGGDGAREEVGIGTKYPLWKESIIIRLQYK